MYNFGVAIGVKLRSSILFAIGKGEEDMVFSCIKSDILLTVFTMIFVSLLFGVSRVEIAKLFFSDSDVIESFSNMILLYSCFMIMDTLVPIMITLIRTFSMNFYATCLVFLAFGIPLSLLTYMFVVFLDLEYFSPILSLLICNVLTMGVGLILLCRNGKRNLRKLIEKNQEYQELIDVD